MNEKEEIMNALVGFPGGALKISPVETQSNPHPPSTGPENPRSNTCMRGPRCVFWKQCPTAPTTCGYEQVMMVGRVGSIFPLLPRPLPSSLGPNLDQHGGLHEVMSTNALIKARPFIIERNLGLRAEMKASAGLPEDLGTVLTVPCPRSSTLTSTPRPRFISPRKAPSCD